MPMARMEHVVFVGFWGVADPLTTASFLPTMELFRRMGYAGRMTLATVERGATVDRSTLPEWLDHVPLMASRLPVRAASRALDLVALPRQLERALRGGPVSLFVARSTLAGSIPLALGKYASVPSIVESVEPHTEYMVHCGNWSPRSLAARVGGAVERAVLRRAAGIITVSERYAARLRAEGLGAAHIHVTPCTVDLLRFMYSPSGRARVRAELGWGADDLVAVYLGKFGGMYLDELAHRAFAEFLRWSGERGRLLVLTATPEGEVRAGLARQFVDQERVRVLKAAHADVPAYLSAADMAFALYKGTPSSAYLSPVKNGEYWASGLPVIMTRGVADDSALIEQEPMAGALFDPTGDDLVQALEQVMDTLASPGQRERTMAFAQLHRSRDLMARTYHDLLTELGLV